MNGCKGDGACLYVDEYICVHNCKLIKCPNYKLCGSNYTERYGKCHQNRCVKCNYLWGNKDLEFIESGECPICFNDQVELIKFPSCIHLSCINCFKTMYFTNNNDDEMHDKCVICKKPMPVPNWLTLPNLEPLGISSVYKESQIPK